MQKENYEKLKVSAWCLYDFANSAYFAVILTFVFATYFTSKLAPNPIIGAELWADSIAISAVFIAIFSPLLGGIADFSGRRKWWLMSSTYLAVISIALMWFAYPHGMPLYVILALVIISNACLEIATVFYNAYLPHLCSRAYLGRISGWAWGVGYIGGILSLILSSVIFVSDVFHLFADKTDFSHIRAIPLFIAAWLCLFSLPLFLIKEEKVEKSLNFRQASKKGIQELFLTIKTLPQQKNLFLFLIANMLYRDGLNTILAMGGIYFRATFDLTLNEILTLGLLLNLTAGIGAIAFAWLDDKKGSKNTILINLAALTMFCLSLTVVDNKFKMWCIAPLVGFFVGPIQAASRTFLARLAKKSEINRMYGLYSFTGKATSFLGPFFVALVTDLTDSLYWGMMTICPFLIMGACILLLVKEPQACELELNGG